MASEYIIEIENGVARSVERRIHGEISLDSLRSQLETRLPTVYPILPDNTKVFSFDPNNKRGALIVELKPARQYLTIMHDRNNGRTTEADNKRIKNHEATFHIQLPYLCFFYSFTLDTRGNTTLGEVIANFAMDKAMLFYRPRPITSLKDKLYPAMLWNVHRADICWGYQTHNKDSVAERINDMVKSFPHTRFTPHYGNPTPNGYADYTAWEAASEDPLLYDKWNWDNWPENFRTIEDMVNGNHNLELTLIDDSNSSYIIPPPPESWTVGRMREYFETLPDNARARFLSALKRELTEPEAAEPIIVQLPEADTTETDIPGVGRVVINHNTDAAT